MKATAEKLQNRISLFESLAEETQGQWGVMSPQNVIEHLGGVFYATAKGFTGKMYLEPDVAAKAKARFFSSYYPFPKGVRMPGTQDEPVAAPHLKYTSLAEAKSKLNNAVLYYLDQLKENPSKTSTHGYFGDLTLEEWLPFHIKHVEHHAMQFGLLPRDEKIPLIEKLLYKVSTKIEADTPAAWGKMNAHQMVEHLGATFLVSMGKINRAYEGTEEDAKQKWEAFQKSDDPWNEVLAGINIGEPRTPRKETIEESKKMLQQAYQKYLRYTEENGSATHAHLAMGDLTVDQWRQVHVKHMQHHLRQFGIAF